jgi:hypothetical protein
MSHMRRRLGLIWLAATAVVSTIVGIISYQAGWAAGVAANLPAGAAVAPFHPLFFFFPGFGFLFFLLFVFLIFRFAFWWGPRGGMWRGGYGRPMTPPPPPPQAGQPWQDWPRREEPAPEPKQ